ncbi:hypothetical protein P154DRAFT_541862 [Amniculicola lignicola CBS 123094]|uniref:Uncharacterized protein n=1 Tax=Amniculicola lignicola CBS 123094 TaxID=1392246 RepID=A0A6A5X0V2_9PLEO|nr:hypothetical protein P154DRAFT_541862 [Amniculicola lignicola CBS 123094]
MGFALLTSALPTELKDFFLVTTTQAEASPISPDVQAASATSLFAPYYQPNLLLRLIGPGYGSLPIFTLESGNLHTFASGPHGQGYFEYNSTTLTTNGELQFLAEEQPEGNLGLSDGYLLTVDGKSEGWTICDGLLSSRILRWKGEGEGCVGTVLQAVAEAPY